MAGRGYQGDEIVVWNPAERRQQDSGRAIVIQRTRGMDLTGEGEMWNITKCERTAQESGREEEGTRRG